MRRCLVLLLLVLFPLQLAFAAAAAYCAHESGTPAKHFGHHEHHAVGQLDNAGDDNDGECAFYQLDCADFPSMETWCASVADAWTAPMFHPMNVPSRDSEPFERPKWRALA
jgi:hypothetical protein